MFVLDKRPPRAYAEGSDRPESAIFCELLDIANGNPGLDYWKEMASRETQAKGKRGRELKLLLPDDDEDTSDSDSLDSHGFGSNSVFSSDDESRAGTAEPEDGQRHAKRVSGSSNALSSSAKNSSARNANDSTALRFPGESQSFLTYTQEGTNPRTGSKRTLGQTSLDAGSQRPAVLRRTQPSTSTSQPSSSRRVETSSDPATAERVPKIEDDGKEKTDLFTLDLRSALGHVFLQEKDADDILAIFHDVVSIKKKPEFEHIRSWLTTHEFKPRLVQLQVNDQGIVSNNVPGQGSNDETCQGREIGDIKAIHRIYRMEAVSDSHDLRQTILSLGRLYLSIRHFAMEGLVEMIILKLQVAWNSYPGISQLVPILDVAAMAFSGGPARNDALRTWLVSFIADTQDLYFYECSPRFWEVMRSSRALYDEVFQRRTVLHRDQPERYSDVLALLRSRGIEEA